MKIGFYQDGRIGFRWDPLAGKLKLLSTSKTLNLSGI